VLFFLFHWPLVTVVQRPALSLFLVFFPHWSRVTVAKQLSLAAPVTVLLFHITHNTSSLSVGHCFVSCSTPADGVQFIEPVAG